MAEFKALAKDTAIYGMSSILGRFLNYLLVPLYTYRLTAAGGEYGVITNLYAYTALLLVILTYGMETAFFRFANKRGEDPTRVFSTTLRCVGTTSLLFVVLVLLFLHPIAGALGYATHPSYIWVMAVVVALDAFQSILFAYLRYKKRPLRFAALKLLFIAMNIALNLCFYLLFPLIYEKNPQAIGAVYNPAVGAGYAFYINLFCTGTITFLFRRELKGLSAGFDRNLLKRMFSYSWPILLLGIAGILNQTFDKIAFPLIYKEADANQQLGIYGAASKIAMIMALITQAFRYAYEPFVFAGVEDKDSKETNARGMKYFIIFTLLAYLCIVAYTDVLKFIIAKSYWPGLRVVPIVMAAEIMMGVYFNLSFWYKLTDKTWWGALFSGLGCLVLMAVNLVFVPRCGYIACAWAGVAGYGTAMLLSYFVGQKYYRIDYPLRDISVYLIVAVLLFFCMKITGSLLPVVPRLVVNTLSVAVFAILIIKRDLPLSEIPVIGKYFKQ